MPPKVKIPREAIIEKAFELTKEYGCQIAEQDLKAFTIWLSTFLFRLNRKCLRKHGYLRMV